MDLKPQIKWFELHLSVILGMAMTMVEIAHWKNTNKLHSHENHKQNFLPPKSGTIQLFVMILVQTLYPEMLLNTPICRTISVSTKPGLIAFTVTPVPVNLRANSRVNIILANLL